MSSRAASCAVSSHAISRSHPRVCISLTAITVSLRSTPEENRYGLSFNLSHAGRLALYTFTRGLAVGIDVELLREEFASIEIAERFFAADEVATLKSLPDEIRTRAFFNCWSRKEAYIKALGEGLSHPLHDFTVAFSPPRFARRLVQKQFVRPAGEASQTFNRVSPALSPNLRHFPLSTAGRPLLSRHVGPRQCFTPARIWVPPHAPRPATRTPAAQTPTGLLSSRSR